MPAASWLMNLGFAGSVAAVTAPTIAGPEYTVPPSRLHCTVPESKLHFTVPESKLHYTAPSEE